ncbi:MAG: hypothetical protein IOD12_11355 [Silvanigrellales bacterium]|nr:hypothetical protein [Silvanigrellales bacterium]
MASAPPNQLGGGVNAKTGGGIGSQLTGGVKNQTGGGAYANWVVALGPHRSSIIQVVEATEHSAANALSKAKPSVALRKEEHVGISFDGTTDVITNRFNKNRFKF